MLLVVNSERGREKEKIIQSRHVLFVCVIYYKVLTIHSC